MEKNTKEYLNEFVAFLKRHWKHTVIAVIAVLCVVCARQCSKADRYKKEIARLENNLLAIGDTLKNYKDGNYNIAEMRTLQLKINELTDSLKLERNKKPVTIIQYITSTKDSIITLVTVVHDTVLTEKDWLDNGYITASDTAFFGNSSRMLNMKVPYTVNCETGLVESDGYSEIYLSQDIWTESVLYKDKKGHTYVRLKTDYPSCTFNSGTAILVTDKDFDYKSRKQFGVGLGIQVGYGADVSTPVRLTPYVGVGISLNWNPRFLQF